MTPKEFAQKVRSGHVHRSLYHFTDASNLPTIRMHGLLSKQRMRTSGFAPERPGGNDLSHRLDEACGISDYVSLCLTKNHPMEHVARNDGRILDPRYLRIDTSVLELPGVRFAFGVANAADTRIVDLAEALPDVDTEVLYKQMVWRDPEIQLRLRAAEKYEILIPGCVPVQMILDFR
ncbi:DarT ssDNA thymidine ADP-ribosyltransferase family protein [Pinisolibacter sp.]|uniref:DarT ssDNA thymidine ADP-ribosyltransferase family protein n=1 Tax=Pinisolibacter sp. TaxID=2172024 RepID=UPI002FDD7C1F